MNKFIVFIFLCFLQGQNAFADYGSFNEDEALKRYLSNVKNKKALTIIKTHINTIAEKKGLYLSEYKYRVTIKGTSYDVQAGESIYIPNVTLEELVKENGKKGLQEYEKKVVKPAKLSLEAYERDYKQKKYEDKDTAEDINELVRKYKSIKKLKKERANVLVKSGLKDTKVKIELLENGATRTMDSIELSLLDLFKLDIRDLGLVGVTVKTEKEYRDSRSYWTRRLGLGLRSAREKVDESDPLSKKNLVNKERLLELHLERSIKEAQEISDHKTGKVEVGHREK